eukprot:398809-Pyramimonas_sp.AAC.1
MLAFVEPARHPGVQVTCASTSSSLNACVFLASGPRHRHSLAVFAAAACMVGRAPSWIAQEWFSLLVQPCEVVSAVMQRWFAGLLAQPRCSSSG